MVEIVNCTIIRHKNSRISFSGGENCRIEGNTIIGESTLNVGVTGKKPARRSRKRASR